jgi:hypothetical protein
VWNESLLSLLPRRWLAGALVCAGCTDPFGAWDVSGGDGDADDHERRPLASEGEGEGEGEGEDCNAALVATVCEGLGVPVDDSGCRCAAPEETPPEQCVRDDFDRTCSNSELQVCSASDSTVHGIECTTLNGFFDEAMFCGEGPCVGAGCAARDNTTCVARFGGLCEGLARLFDGDDGNDDFGAVPCESGVCVAADRTGEITGFFDQCESATGFTRTTCDETVPADERWCDGNHLVTCFSRPSAQFAWATPFALDCPSVFPGSTCGAQQECACDAQCDAGVACVGGFCAYSGPICVTAPDPTLCE